MNQHAKRRHQAMGRHLQEREDARAPRPAPKPILPTLEGAFETQVDAALAGERLDRGLARAVEAAGLALSRTRIKALIDEGRVQLDGAAAADAGARLREGQNLRIDVPAAAPAEPVGEDMPLTIVFEDAHLIVLDKPAGLVVHPAAGHETGTLVNALIAHCGDSLSGIGGVKRPGIVHRLDKDTSGLLVVAKTNAAHQGLAMLFADHGRNLSLTREYCALLWGAPERPSGTIDANLGRHATHREKIAVVSEERGREAITHWRREETFGADKHGAPLASLIACALETGRTHQIRVHMAHIGHPVMGDPLYATGFRTKAAQLPPKAQSALAKLGRQALHAAILGFAHPITGEELMFESKPPADMTALMKALRGA
jgi:23S rRNA pseudouridine1911/1915/1917 synthase